MTGNINIILDKRHYTNYMEMVAVVTEAAVYMFRANGSFGGCARDGCGGGFETGH